MKPVTLAAIIAVFALSITVFADEPLTIQMFQEIATAPGDEVPLQPELARAQPFWRKSCIVITCKYSDGRTTEEKLPMTAKTVGGKYIVYSVPSAVYGRQMDSIMSFDFEEHTIKIWGFYGNIVTEGTLVYDLERRIYSMFSRYTQDGVFTEVGVGYCSDKEIADRTVVTKDRVFFLTRDTRTTPVE